MDRQLTSFERRLEILFILMRNNKCSERLGISLFCFRQDNSQGYTVFEPICTHMYQNRNRWRSVFNERVPKRALFTFVHRRGKSFVKAYAYRL